MKICKNCRQVFDPSIAPSATDTYANDFLCSWHPGSPENVGNAGARDDYADIYRWTCCGKSVPGAVIGGRDYPPRRTPGCTSGHHVPDADLLIDPALSAQLQDLQSRLRDLEAQELRPPEGGGVFISYCHRDSPFVDLLTARLVQDQIAYWRDDKDLLVGDVIDRAISDGIQRNALFLVVVTSSSVNSSWVNRELDEASHEAAEGRKVILPVIASGLAVGELPARLRRFKCADFSAQFDEAYSQLRRSIHAHLGRSADGVP